jgi:hypothetical protein
MQCDLEYAVDQQARARTQSSLLHADETPGNPSTRLILHLPTEHLGMNRRQEQNVPAVQNGGTLLSHSPSTLKLHVSDSTSAAVMMITK